MGVIGVRFGAGNFWEDHLISESTRKANIENKSRIKFMSKEEFYQQVCGKVYLTKTFFISD